MSYNPFENPKRLKKAQESESSQKLESSNDKEHYTGLRCSFCGAPTKMVVRNSSDELFHACKPCKIKHDLSVCIITK